MTALIPIRPYGAEDARLVSLETVAGELSAARGMTLTAANVEHLIALGQLPGWVVLIEDRPHVTEDDAAGMVERCAERRAS